MLFGSGLTLLLCSIFAHVSSQSCRCKVLLSRGLRANCSSQGLTTVPHLPGEITELLLQNNLLTTVTPGHLDQLHHLQLVNLSRNPFHCDCSIQYLNQIKSNHFYCHITTAQVPWWVKFLRACSRQCKKTKQQFTYGQYIFTDCTEDNLCKIHIHILSTHSVL